MAVIEEDGLKGLHGHVKLWQLACSIIGGVLLAAFTAGATIRSYQADQASIEVKVETFNRTGTDHERETEKRQEARDEATRKVIDGMRDDVTALKTTVEDRLPRRSPWRTE